jgi:hypothetical protein
LREQLAGSVLLTKGIGPELLARRCSSSSGILCMREDASRQ